jgi:hypothetical protein
VIARIEARVGQRTTLDVLNAQQALVNARLNLLTAQHDRVLASYNLLSAVAGYQPRSFVYRCKSTIRRFIITRCAIAGPVSARPTGDRFAEAEAAGGPGKMMGVTYELHRPSRDLVLFRLLHHEQQRQSAQRYEH